MRLVGDVHADRAAQKLSYGDMLESGGADDLRDFGRRMKLPYGVGEILVGATILRRSLPCAALNNESKWSRESQTSLAREETYPGRQICRQA